MTEKQENGEITNIKRTLHKKSYIVRINPTNIEFVAKLRAKGQLTVPKEVMEWDELKEGDLVIVSIIKKGSRDQLKHNLEKRYAEQSP